MDLFTTFLSSFFDNFSHNLFKPLLLFFYAGFLVPLLNIKFEFPTALYQALTIYLLIAIGWHGGEELAILPAQELSQVWGFMLVGFFSNVLIAVIAYNFLRNFTSLRRIDAATVGAYYGSDSAGTFVTAVGVLTAANIAFAPYMPVMLAVMEIPGCLVGLYLVSSFRNRGLDEMGNMPGEEGYRGPVKAVEELEEETVLVPAFATATENSSNITFSALEVAEQTFQERKGALTGQWRRFRTTLSAFSLDKKLLHEVFFNPGIYLLFAGITIGFVSRRQGPEVVLADDAFLVKMFQGALCLFLLEMGITAARKLKDLGQTGWAFIGFALLAPTVFATSAIVILHTYSHLTGMQFELGTYVLFAALCGSASYIAVPAVQRIAIPEASPTLPLAASLGVTFTFNVTIGIPLYIEIARQICRLFPL